MNNSTGTYIINSGNETTRISLAHRHANGMVHGDVQPVSRLPSVIPFHFRRSQWRLMSVTESVLATPASSSLSVLVTPHRQKSSLFAALASHVRSWVSPTSVALVSPSSRVKNTLKSQETKVTVVTQTRHSPALDMSDLGHTPRYLLCLRSYSIISDLFSRSGMLNAILDFARSCIKRSKNKKVKVIIDEKGTAQKILAAIHEALGTFPCLNCDVSFAP